MSQPTSNSFHIVCIDVGICNLGLASIEVTNEYKIEAIEYVERIDIRDFTHRLSNISSCPMHARHNSTVLADRVAHFMQEYHDLFDKARVVLIEQQPLQGLTAVEQLIIARYRNKSHMISPVAMHRYFGLVRGDYEARKLSTVGIGRRYIEDYGLSRGNMLDYFDRQERNHDIADAICLGVFWVDRERRRYEKELKERERQDRIANMHIRGVKISDLGYCPSRIRLMTCDAPARKESTTA